MQYYTGKVVKKDLAKAVHWFRKSAEQGYAPAQASLGMKYFTGEGIARDANQAVHWLRKAAEQGDANGQNVLGICYYLGQGVDEDIDIAAYWLKQAAQQDESILNPGFCCDIGLHYLSLCKERGYEQFTDETAYWLLLAARLGYAEAQYHIAMCYWAGVGVDRDLKESFNWFHKAAEQGDAGALYELSMCYLKGEGVAKSIGNAARWFIKLLDQEPVKEQEWLDIFRTDSAPHLPKEDVDNFLDSVAKQRKSQQMEQAEREHNQWAQQGLCPVCGEKPGLFGKCKKCGADKLLGLRTGEEWKEIIAKATRPLEVRIKAMDTPSKKLAAIRDTQMKIASQTGHPVALVSIIYEKYADKPVQKSSAFKK